MKLIAVEPRCCPMFGSALSARRGANNLVVSPVTTRVITLKQFYGT